MEIEEEGNETTVHHTIKNYGKLRGWASQIQLTKLTSEAT
jgi:hypothetical protein